MNKEYLNEEEKKQFELFLKQTYKEGIEKINLSSDYQIPILKNGTKILMDIINWHIKFLNLSLYSLQDEGMQEVIKRGEQWPTLQLLKLQKNKLTCLSLKGISNSKWSKLMHLNLDKNKIKGQGFREIVKADWPELRSLCMAYCQIGEEGAQEFYNSKWPKLQELSMRYNLIGNQGARALSSCSWPNLKDLQLSNNKIDGKGIFYISQLESPNLKCLSLNRNEIGKVNNQLSDLGCYYLTNIKSNQIESLHIFGNDISLNGIRIIFKSGKLVSNCYLEVIRNLFSFADIKNDVDAHKYFCNYFQN